MIIPSLITDNERVAEERIRMAQQMSGWLHIDILDNTLYKFVSLSVKELEKFDYGDLFLEFHCMTTNPMQVVESELNVDRLILHYEVPDWQDKYKELVRHGVNTWLAIDPSTKIDTINLPPDLNGIVLMGVNPGQGGQVMMPKTFDRIQAFREYYSDMPITVDGGVTGESIRELLALGVDNLIMGNAIWSRSDPLYAYQKYQHLSDPIGGMYDSEESGTKSKRHP